MTVTQLSTKERIAARVALEISDGDVLNLGAGLPAMVAQFLPDGISVMIHSENGLVGITGQVPYEDRDPMLLNASNQYVHLVPGASTFGSDVSFGIMRGGHLDVTVLGAMQVDAEGNLANWWVKDGPIVGMGGAMDLVVSTRKVIVATEHCDRTGASKILPRCTYPLTAVHVVDLIVTELAVIEVTDAGLVLREVAEGVTPDEVVARTAAPLLVPPHVPLMKTQPTSEEK